MAGINPSTGQCTRRQLIRSLAGGSLLFPGLLSELLAGGHQAPAGVDALAPRAPHFPARAKQVIFLYMSGGVSHVDSFDPKPKLFSDHGQKGPTGVLKRPDWEFKPRGQCGTEVSDLFPQIATWADDLCLIRSLRGDHGNHFEASLGLHTGSVTFARPSLGSWVSYGLGTPNRNMPAFVVLAPYLPYAGAQVWGADFLPAAHQGTRIIPGDEPIPNIRRRLSSPELQEMELGFLQSLNRKHLKPRSADPALAGRIKSFETAFGMQMEAPEIFDLSRESDATHERYGLLRGSRFGFGWPCLVARRLIERGVRFVELIDSGASLNWDSHRDMADHGERARNVDRPIAALLQDLKSRGLLEETLVVWTTEFGRTPFVEKIENRGREHHPQAFSSWLAGGGVKRGIAYGATDEYGIKVVENEVHIHDIHATILHLLGLNHEALTYRHAGRDFRLTDIHGQVVKGILA